MSDIDFVLFLLGLLTLVASVVISLFLFVKTFFQKPLPVQTLSKPEPKTAQKKKFIESKNSSSTVMIPPPIEPLPSLPPELKQSSQIFVPKGARVLFYEKIVLPPKAPLDRVSSFAIPKHQPLSSVKSFLVLASILVGILLFVVLIGWLGFQSGGTIIIPF